MRKLSILLIVLLASCATIGDSKTIEYKRVARSEVKQHCSHAHNPAGCATYNSMRCVIYVANDIPFNSSTEQFVAGHELLHCFRGDYHPKGKIEP